MARRQALTKEDAYRQYQERLDWQRSYYYRYRAACNKASKDQYLRLRKESPETLYQYRINAAINLLNKNGYTVTLNRQKED